MINLVAETDIKLDPVRDLLGETEIIGNLNSFNQSFDDTSGFVSSFLVRTIYAVSQHQLLLFSLRIDRSLICRC